MIFSKKKKDKPKGKPAKKPVVEPIEKAEVPVKKLSASQIREKKSEGWIQVLVTFELVGSPKEHIDSTLKAYLANIMNDGRVLSIEQEFAEPLEQDDGMFSAFCELDCLVRDLEVLTWLAINFMPASMEILDPDKLAIESRVLGNWFNDLLAKLHEVSGVLREERAVNQHLTQGMNSLIKNCILLVLKGGTANPADLESRIGISVKQLEPFLNALVEKGTIVKKKEKYALP